MNVLRVGAMLYGFCGGHFGRDSYYDKRVEAIGADWVVARTNSGTLCLFEGNPEDLLPYTVKPDDYDEDL